MAWPLWTWPLVVAAAMASSTDLCKRSNFASTECAASVVETSPGVKNIRNVLRQDKDTYAMFECSAPANFMVIELCQDIQIDEISLANYEFFSSQFKDIRFSASDRYPAEPAQWFPLGDFVTNNTRQNQAFTFDSPKVWTRYLKVEFLSHWDREFYCPLTTITVHGTTMIDKFKQDDDLASQLVADSDDGDCVPNARSCPAEPLRPELPEMRVQDVCAIPDHPHPNSLLTCPAPRVAAVSSLPGDKQCCVRPAPSPAPPAPIKESVYESLNKRLANIETNYKQHAAALDEYRGSMQTFFQTLTDQLVADAAQLAAENQQLRQTVDGLGRDVAAHRTTAYFQTCILVVLIIYLLSPRGGDAHPRGRFRAATLEAASSDEYENETLDMLSDPDYTYNGLDPRTPSFTPSRPGSPLEAGPFVVPFKS